MANATQALTVAKSLIQKPEFQEQLKSVLPKHMTPERQARVLINCMSRTPKLAECTPISLMRCMLDCSSMGLEPDGRLAHLIPYGKECTLVVDYKGLIDMILRSGKVTFVDAFVVYEEELKVDPNIGKPRFTLRGGSNPEITHEPIIDRDPGNIIGAYAVAHIKGMDVAKFEFLRRDEIDKVKAQSRGAAKPDSPWKKWYGEMAKKTAIRRLAKTLPLSSEQSEILLKELEVDGLTNTSTIPESPADIEVQATVVEEPNEPEAPKAPKKTRKTTAKSKAKPAAPAPAPEQPDNVTDMPPAEDPPTEDEPPAEEPPAEEPPAEEPEANPLDAPEEEVDDLAHELQQFAARDGFSEEQVCAWARERMKMPETVTSFALMVQAAPKKTARIIQNWDSHVKPELSA